MGTEVIPALPDRSALRKLYDTAIAEINATRGSKLLTTDFYAKTGDAVFDVGCLALSDAMTDTRRIHTVSAPPGGGKTTFSHAFVIALARYACVSAHRQLAGRLLRTLRWPATTTIQQPPKPARF
jgi:hypothetical protein